MNEQNSFLVEAIDPFEATSYSRKAALQAWMVHLFTASGVIWGFWAMLAIMNGNWMLAFLWMSLAVFVDSVDGALARRFQVQTILPNFDGALLDNVIDYFNYVVVPAFFMYEAGLFPANLGPMGGAVILLASAYQFCQADAKTDDHYFKGFPSYWNIVAFYLFFLGLSSTVNLIIIWILALLVFVPLKFLYPSRTDNRKRLNLWLSGLWGSVNVLILLQYPSPAPILIWLSLSYVGYYAVSSVIRTLQKRARA